MRNRGKTERRKCKRQWGGVREKSKIRGRDVRERAKKKEYLSVRRKSWSMEQSIMEDGRVRGMRNKEV